uniref:Putative secreted peptide n=1 Tax=Anopheles braziliensis TaxID=58242 RepID=A0A2M3ZV51_9DIPT
MSAETSSRPYVVACSLVSLFCCFARLCCLFLSERHTHMIRPVLKRQRKRRHACDADTLNCVSCWRYV